MKYWIAKNEYGYWCARWKDSSGSSRRQSLGTKLKRVAEKRIRRFRPGTKHTKVAGVSLREAVTAWSDFKAAGRRELTRGTLAEYASLAGVLLEMGSERVSRVSALDIEKWADKRVAIGDSPALARKRLGMLSSALEWVAAYHPRWGLKSNPARVVLKATPKPRGRRRAVIDSEGFADMIERLRASEDGSLHELADTLVIQWVSGLRATEVSRLRWEDIDLKREVWRIQSPSNKGGDSTIPMHPVAAQILASIPRSFEGPFPAPGTTMKRWARWQRVDAFAAGMHRGGIRHTFITELRRAGLHHEAKALARHATSSMSDHYTHLNEGMLKAALHSSQFMRLAHR